MNRVKQFFKSITATVNKRDKTFVDIYLNEEEKNILYSLPRYDIKHSINVAKDILHNEDKLLIKEEGLNIDLLIKSALLHDVGKIYKKLNPIDKSVLVILNSASKGKLKKYQHKNKKIYIFYNHGEEGYNILKKVGRYDNDFLKVVRYHHIYSKNNTWLDKLRKYDNRN